MNSEKLLRSVRKHPALFGAAGLLKEEQARRILVRCKINLGYDTTAGPTVRDGYEIDCAYRGKTI